VDSVVMASLILMGL